MGIMFLFVYTTLVGNTFTDAIDFIHLVNGRYTSRLKRLQCNCGQAGLQTTNNLCWYHFRDVNHFNMNNTALAVMYN